MEAFRLKNKKEEAIAPLQNGTSGIVFSDHAIQLLTTRTIFLVTCGGDTPYKSISFVISA